MKLRLFLVFALTVTTAFAQNLADNSKSPVSDTAPATATANPLTESLTAARALINTGKFTEAAAAFRALLEKNPAYPEAHAGLVQSLLRAHNLDDARDAAAK